MLEVLCCWIDPSPSLEPGQRLAPLQAAPYLPGPFSPLPLSQASGDIDIYNGNQSAHY